MNKKKSTGKKYITKVDNVWHDYANKYEVPPFSTEVEYMDKDGNIHKGEIVVEISGYYLYVDKKWKDIEDITKWRFIKDKNYPMYENYEE